MRDVHCHILPLVDDGASSLDESLAMLEAAQAVGITSIVCTPHCRDPYFDYDEMCNAFSLLKAHAGNFCISMGFEIYYPKLIELGMGWLDRLAFENSNEILLEFPTKAHPVDFKAYERTIFEIQSKGYKVIIAHPERYRAIQNDRKIAYNLVDSGCRLQASANFLSDGRFGIVRKTANRLLKEGLYSYIASDAHHVGHYKLLGLAKKKYQTNLRSLGE